jgi:hypothetical protein
MNRQKVEVAAASPWRLADYSVAKGAERLIAPVLH